MHRFLPLIAAELPYEELRTVQGRAAWAVLAVVGAICVAAFAAALGRVWARARLRPCPHCREFIDRAERACPRCGAGLGKGWAGSA
ncbi:MAG: hypothetical protein N3A38_10395 [Planctomycetota bacterium]|nr:hypothetical protein [Planctomycetota bacterium]